MKSGELVFAGVVIVVLGMLIIFAGMIKESVTSKDAGNGGIRGGGVIMIGPIPIIFGTDKDSIAAVIVLAILLIVVSYFLFRRVR
jgi:uncharacterized protein (TIGR00304 family)